MPNFSFPSIPSSPEESRLRAEVRAFLSDELSAGSFTPQADCWVSAASPAFSKKLGQRGWIGMTWPKCYGGGGHTNLDRLVVAEELLSAGAPVAAHWIADRQTGSQILKYGSEAQKASILPRMAAGECFSCIGMSEPQAGSDLAAVQTKAVRSKTGWRLSGRKIWTTVAHLSTYIVVLARTSQTEGRNRHFGLSQFLVDLKTPGIDITGIADLEGNTHFNEVLFDDVDIPADSLLGEEGDGWAQCMGELSLERSGPERFLTTLALLSAALAEDSECLASERLGGLIAEAETLRAMSRSIAHAIDEGGNPSAEAALVKQLGAVFEKEVFESVRAAMSRAPTMRVNKALEQLSIKTQLRLPSHSLRGGTTEILRGIIARQLGVR